ncbi:MAG: NGG1p interacting factor NIF3 [Spirochaetaceae bacterium]|nr:MAG: NGG1p interacting factor NIF3 [Spirochaetaceae bacterium]
MYKLVFFVPEDHAERVKDAVFAAGAGRYRDYDSCSWQTTGLGQFRPLEGASPFIGERDRVERVPEVRIETICKPGVVRAVLTALISAHPYEEPAYDVTRVYTVDDLPE